MILFRDKFRSTNNKVKFWIDDIEILGDKKEELLASFKKNMEKLRENNNMKEYSESILEILKQMKMKNKKNSHF